MSELPEGWITMSTGELGSWRGGGTPSKANSAFWTDGTIPWVSPKDMKRPQISDADDKITEAALVGSATQLIPEDSILLVTRSGILQHSLPVAANTVPVTINQDLKALTPYDGIDTQFVRLQFQANAQEILRECAKSGTTVESIDFDLLKQHRFRLAPIPEQQRIVAKLNGLTTRTARARADLDRVPKLIARYKSRLLALAFSGERLVARTTLGDISERVTKGESPGWQGFEYQEEGILFVRSQNVGWGKLLLGDQVFLDPTFNLKREKSTIQSGDVLLNIVGASIGRTAVATEDIAGANCNQAVAIIRLQDRDVSDQSYVCWWLQSPEAQGLITDGAVDVARANFSLASIRKMNLPWPSKLERSEIVRRIETAFGWLARMAANHHAAAKLLPKLDAAILAKAFQGELVPQDPNDEPARLLLDRIRADQIRSPKKDRAGSSRRAASKVDVVPQLEESVPELAFNRSQTGKIVIKNRHDPDVYWKPYLADILRNRARPCKVDELQSASGLRVADFYKQLAWEIGQGLIRDSDDGFEVS
jgi:type I restriction enzyme S subunit